MTLAVGRWFEVLLSICVFVLAGFATSGCAESGAKWARGPLPSMAERGPARASAPGDFEEADTAGSAPAGEPAVLAPPSAPSPVAAKSLAQGPKPASGAASPASRAEQASPHAADMLIYTASLAMAVYQVEPGLDAVERIGREVGGYLAQRSDTSITIRVPRARFDDALHRIEASGDVLHRDVSAEDVTDQYVEIETRLRNARKMRDRLEELLARAQVKEAIDIEKELGRVTGEIESMEGKLKVLRDKIAYSTITVTFEPRGSGAVRDMPLRLPFPWLSSLGLPRLLSLQEGAR